jgi:hypothetical protein
MVFATTHTTPPEATTATATSPAPNMDATPGTSPPEITAMRSVTTALQTLLNSCAQSDMENPLQRRSEPERWTVIEHAIYVRDLLRATAERLERLAADAQPVHVQPMHCEPIGGYHRWDAEALAPVLGAEAERLVRLTRELATTDRVPPETRHGLESIAAQLLRDACKDGAEHIKQAESSVAL